MSTASLAIVLLAVPVIRATIVSFVVAGAATMSSSSSLGHQWKGIELVPLHRGGREEFLDFINLWSGFNPIKEMFGGDDVHRWSG